MSVLTVQQTLPRATVAMLIPFAAFLLSNWMKHLLGLTLFVNLFDPIANHQAYLSGAAAAVWLGLVAGGVLLAWALSGAGLLQAARSQRYLVGTATYLAVFSLTCLLIPAGIIKALVGD